jgi:hypothetical protein
MNNPGPDIIEHYDGTTHPNTNAYRKNCDLCGPDKNEEDYDQDLYDSDRYGPDPGEGGDSSD